MSSLIVVSAPSGTGKSTILRRTLERDPRIRFAVSHTTRTPRAGEQSGREYYFVQRGEFEGMIARNAFLEYAHVHGELYGTSRAECARAERDDVDLLLDLDVQGAAQVRSKVDDAVLVFLLPPSFDELERRLRGRGQDSAAAIGGRLEAARREIGEWERYDYAIVNDDLDAAQRNLEAVIAAARCRPACVRSRGRAILKSFPHPKE